MGQGRQQERSGVPNVLGRLSSAGNAGDSARDSAHDSKRRVDSGVDSAQQD